MRKLCLTVTLLGVIVLALPFGVVHAAVVYPFETFTDNGGYYNSPELKLYVEVSDGEGRVDFTFYNESLFESSIAGIYFDDGSLLGIYAITEGAGTSFSQPATPGNLPAGNTLEPPFVTAVSIGSDAPRPKNGINPGEWVRVTFNLIDDSMPATVIDELNTGALRIGVHIIALPDGSSESAVAVPEPATIVLLGLGGLALLCKRRA